MPVIEDLFKLYIESTNLKEAEQLTDTYYE